jgi:hypothetical protein
MWSTSSWDKICQLNAEVAAHSVFNSHPTRGDVAFDGENGMIRLLPGTDQVQSTRPKADIDGFISFVAGCSVTRGKSSPDGCL